MWKALTTADGKLYWRDDATGAISWTPPAEKTAPKQLDGQYFWVRHPDEAFVPAQLGRKLAGGRLEARTLQGELLVLEGRDVKEEISHLSSLQQVPHDLVQLEDVSDATVVYALRQRYLKEEIYTRIGDILVAVNPFKLLPLYTPLIMGEYMAGDPRDLAPHVYGIAATAYARLLDLGVDQSILISGESGAGKTESTKQCLHYLSEAAGSPSGVEQKILASNPILESFGNAKTTRNNNSSRFGKFMQLYFSTSGKIIGCDIVNYLLEKSRIMRPGPNERTYHVFYQLCFAANDISFGEGGGGHGVNRRTRRDGARSDADKKVGMPNLAHLGLTEAEHFRCLTLGNCTNAKGIDEGRDYFLNIQGMQNLGFTTEERQQIAEACAAIMHLGNLGFEDHSVAGAEGSRITEGLESLSYSARLLGVSEDELSERLRTRALTIRRETSMIQLNAGKASDARDALASAIYRNLFDHLVNRINLGMMESSGAGSLEGLRESEHKIIGILDIFGFEIFEVNSFEQLCINYCNEKLQQQFNRHTFKTEEEAYKSEGVQYTSVPYVDNQDVLDLIEKKPKGILPLLDEEVRLPRTTDFTYLRKLNENYLHKHKRFEQPRGEEGRVCFTVQHYAGPVAYHVGNFLDKNKDELSEDVYAMLTRSRNGFVSNVLFGNVNTSNKRDTQGGKFRKQLNKLMETLNQASPHYIRCIKPNSDKLPGEFQGASCYSQLQCSGVFEAVSIRKSGYPFRMTHKAFFQRFKVILSSRFSHGVPRDYKEACRTLIHSLAGEPGLAKVADAKVGRTMILWRQTEDRPLSAKRAIVREQNARRIQSLAGLFCAKLLRRRLLRLREQIFSAMESEEVAEVDKVLELSSKERFRIREHALLESHKRKLVETERVKGLLEQLQSKAIADIDDEFEDAVNLAIEWKINTTAALKCIEMYEQVRERRQVIRELAEICEQDLVDILQLEDLLRRVDSLKATHGADFAGEDESEAREILAELREEQRLCKDIYSALLNESIHVEGSSSGEASLKSPLPLTSSLQATVEAAKGREFRSPVGAAVMQLAEVTFDLRTAMRSVAEHASVLFEGDEWKKLPGLLEEREESMAFPEGAVVGGKVIDVDLEVLKDVLAAESRAVQMCQDAYRALVNPIGKALEAHKISDDGQALRTAVSECEAMHAKLKNELFNKDVADMKSRLKTLEQEKQFIEDLRDALSRGGPTDDFSKLKSSDVSCEILEELCNRAEKNFPEPHLESTVDAIRVAKHTLEVRTAVKNGLGVQDVPGDQGGFAVLQAAWQALEQLLVQGTPLSKLELYPKAEMENCKELLLSVADVDGVISKVQAALDASDESKLGYALEQAKRFALDSHPDEETRRLLKSAQEFYDGIRRVNRLVGQALEGPKTHVLQVGEAIAAAESFGYERVPGGTEKLRELREYRYLVEHICEKAHQAWQGVDYEELRATAAQCEELKIFTDDAMLIRTLADLSYKRWLQYMLNMMKFLGRQEAATDITLLTSDLFFETASNMFQLPTLHKLRSAKDFLRATWSFQAIPEEALTIMLSWADQVIGTSVTILRGRSEPALSVADENEGIKLAISAFECIMGYMGDRQYSYPPMLAQEVVRIALHSKNMADEVYVQLMKQLTRNPTQASFNKGLDLMGILLHAVSPTDALANYVECFLRGIRERRLVRLMHLTAMKVNMRSGEIISLEEIGKIAGRKIHTGWLTLQNKGRVYSTWTSYWFMLEGVELRYFKEEGNFDQQAKGTIDVSSISNIANRYLEDQPEKQEFLFDIVADKTTWTLAASDFNERGAWLSALQEAKQSYWNTAM